MRNGLPNVWPVRCPTCESLNSARSSPDRSRDGGSPTSGPRSSRSSTPSTVTRFAGGVRAPAATSPSGTSSSRAASARSRRTSTTPADQAFVRRLALESDLLIENFRPGRLERWNLDPEDLIAANPRLVVVRISGYGQTGPFREQPGFGTIAEAAGGLRYITGEPEGPPTRVGLSLGDSIASMHAIVGALIALHERERSGRGQIVDVALTESLITMLESVIPEYGYLGMVRERTGNIAHNSAPTNAFLCADGAFVCIAANTTGLFRALFQAIGREDYAEDPDLASNQGRVGRAAELDSVIADWTRTRTAGDVVVLLRERQVPVSRINSIADIAADPQVLAREMIVAVDDDRLDRPLLVPGIAPKLSRTPGRVPALARPLGADTEAVRAQFGDMGDRAADRPEPSTAGKPVEAGTKPRG